MLFLKVLRRYTDFDEFHKAVHNRDIHAYFPGGPDSARSLSILQTFFFTCEDGSSLAHLYNSKLNLWKLLGHLSRSKSAWSDQMPVFWT